MCQRCWGCSWSQGEEQIAKLPISSFGASTTHVTYCHTSRSKSKNSRVIISVERTRTVLFVFVPNNWIFVTRTRTRKLYCMFGFKIRVRSFYFRVCMYWRAFNGGLSTANQQAFNWCALSHPSHAYKCISSCDWPSEACDQVFISSRPSAAASFCCSTGTEHTSYVLAAD